METVLIGLALIVGALAALIGIMLLDKATEE